MPRLIPTDRSLPPAAPRARRLLRGLCAVLVMAAQVALPLRAQAQLLPGMGDGGEMTAAAERHLGDQIARELYRDPDFIDDPVLVEYVQDIWQRLLAAARLRGDLTPELDERFARAGSTSTPTRLPANQSLAASPIS